MASSLDKYLAKEVVVTKASGIPEAPVAKELVAVPAIANKEPKRDVRQQSKIKCQYQGACSDKEDNFCYFKGKYCSQQRRVKA
jgi:hypothetical protein